MNNVNRIGKIPCLEIDDGLSLPESSIIIEFAIVSRRETRA